MVTPLVAAGAGLAAAGLAGSIFGKKKKVNYDISGIQNLIQQGGQEERAQLARLRPETQKLTDTFRSDVSGAQDRARADQAASGKALISELDPVTSRLLQSQTDQLKRTTFGQIPEAQQAAREALAATGGLQRGVSAESLARVPIEAARTFGEGAANLQQESLRTQQDALQNLQSQESQLISKNLGIDADTYNTILNSGNAALIGELNGLIEEARNRTQGLVGAEQFRQTGNVANAAAENANQQAIYSSLTNLGGNLIGGGLPQGVEEVAPAQRKRRAVMSLFDRAGTANA